MKYRLCSKTLWVKEFCEIQHTHKAEKESAGPSLQGAEGGRSSVGLRVQIPRGGGCDNTVLTAFTDSKSETACIKKESLALKAQYSQHLKTVWPGILHPGNHTDCLFYCHTVPLWLNTAFFFTKRRYYWRMKFYFEDENLYVFRLLY